LPPPVDGQQYLEQVGLLLGVSRGTSPPESNEDFRARLVQLRERKKHERAGHPKPEPPDHPPAHQVTGPNG
jgi:hypothetical protein